MSDIERPKISRGSKLYIENTSSFLNSVKTNLSGSVDQGQLEKGMGSFWIGPMTIPAITSTFSDREGSSVGGIQNAYLIPFIVPPLRDEFKQEDRNPVYDTTLGGVSKVVLDAITFGYDNRDSRAPVSDHRNSAAIGAVNYADAGKMNFDQEIGDDHPYTLSIVIYQKEQYFFQDLTTRTTRSVYPKDDAYALGREVWRKDLSGSSVTITEGKPNPFSQSRLGIELDRYSTYVIAIYCHGLGEPSAALNKSYALVGATIGLRCLHPLVAADDVGATTYGPAKVQNAPKYKTGSELALTTASPAAGDPISADDASHGIAKVMGDIDIVAQDGITGGAIQEGEKLYNRSLVKDSCYEVIAVPLMQNRARGGVGSYTYGGATSDVLGEPYIYQNAVVAGDTPGNRIEDVRVIPIKYPLTVHNIFLAWSWERFLQETGVTFSNTYGFVPQSPTMKVSIGVAIGEGIGSDNISYQQVAYKELIEPIETGQSGEPDPTTWDEHLIDRIRAAGIFPGPERNPDATTAGSAENISLWAHEIHQIPVNMTTSRPPRDYEVGTYYEQGEPFFMSRAWTGTGDFDVTGSNVYGLNRSGINKGTSISAPATGGRETFLEVRMQITDDVAPLSDYGDLLNEREIISGYGGHWLYIIGKKQLVGDL